jgi:hypothetical protein
VAPIAKGLSSTTPPIKFALTRISLAINYVQLPGSAVTRAHHKLSTALLGVVLRIVITLDRAPGAKLVIFKVVAKAPPSEKVNCAGREGDASVGAGAVKFILFAVSVDELFLTRKVLSAVVPCVVSPKSSHDPSAEVLSSRGSSRVGCQNLKRSGV